MSPRGRCISPVGPPFRGSKGGWSASKGVTGEKVPIEKNRQDAFGAGHGYVPFPHPTLWSLNLHSGLQVPECQPLVEVLGDGDEEQIREPCPEPL